MHRRHFLQRTLLALSSAPLVGPLFARMSLQQDPFTLGIASGDISATTAVLWTRLAPDHDRADGGMPATALPVQWTLASEAAMRRVVRHGTAVARPELAHSVHIELEGLEPGKHYWYQFRVGEYQSAVGHTKTLPASDADVQRVRFATASCQNYTHGLFIAYDHMVADEPDFVIHLGDYIYDVAYGQTFRQHETEDDAPPKTLDAYRRRHALYKTDPSLQRAHAALPFFCVIDNHDAAEDASASFAAQRAAAYQAWYEHMPARGYAGIGQNGFDMHRHISVGQLAEISLLDARQYRDTKAPCDEPFDASYGFGNYRSRCAAILDTSRSMLGEDQEAWLTRTLANNNARWTVLASPGPLLPFSYQADGEDRRYIGAWDAYPKNRERVVAALTNQGVGHPIVLSGDVHSFWAVDGNKTTLPDERFPLVEFVTSGISANWPPPLADIVSENLSNNPQVALYDPDHRGYLLHDVAADTWTTAARGVGNAQDAKANAVTVATYTVKHGTAGFSIRR